MTFESTLEFTFPPESLEGTVEAYIEIDDYTNRFSGTLGGYDITGDDFEWLLDNDYEEVINHDFLVNPCMVKSYLQDYMEINGYIPDTMIDTAVNKFMEYSGKCFEIPYRLALYMSSDKFYKDVANFIEVEENPF